MNRALRLYRSFAFVLMQLESRQRKDAEIISEILLKAASEPEFRNELIKNPGIVLREYNVSAEAMMIIKRSIIDLTQ